MYKNVRYANYDVRHTSATGNIWFTNYDARLSSGAENKMVTETLESRFGAAAIVL